MSRRNFAVASCLLCWLAVSAGETTQSTGCTKVLGVWYQCGGHGRTWEGMCCRKGTQCILINQFYSQCTPTTSTAAAGNKEPQERVTEAPPAPSGPTPAASGSDTPSSLPDDKGPRLPEIDPVLNPPRRPTVAASFNPIDAPDSFNYGEVLSLSLQFFEAQEAGKLPSNNSIAWRGDSFTQTKDNRGRVIDGGWFTDGGFVRYTQPTAWSVSMLAWGILDFGQGYVLAGQLPNALSTLKWGAGYLQSCVVDASTLITQIGDPTVDDLIWDRPEDLNQTGDTYVAYHGGKENPATEVAASVAAALAAVALVFQDVDPGYAKGCRIRAQQMYMLAKHHPRANYSTSLPLNVSSAYTSTSAFDHLAYAAIWLFRLTSRQAFLSEARLFMNKHLSNEVGGRDTLSDWDSTGGATSFLISLLADSKLHTHRTQAFLNSWLSGSGGVSYTPKHRAFVDANRGLRQSTNAAFLAAVYANSDRVSPYQAEVLACFSHHQAGGVLGDGGRSYVVGYGNDPPCRPRHRGASCPLPPRKCDWKAYSTTKCNPNTLYGALVSGPNTEDRYNDNRRNPVFNSVGVLNNAAFTGLLAYLQQTPFQRADCKAHGLFNFPGSKPLFP